MADNIPRLLVIEDEVAVRRAVKRLIEKVAGFEVIDCGSAEAGLDLMEQHDVDAVLVDQGLPGITGLEMISQARRRFPLVEYILFTGLGDVGLAYSALENGATDYFTKPIEDQQRFVTVIRRAVEARRLRTENAALKQRRKAGKPEKSPADRLILGQSEAMERVREQVRRFAAFPSENVLITGETGSGKDQVAKALSAEGGRKGTYQAVNCGAIPSQLMESMLFGHVRGSFTGTVGDQPGLFDLAGDGIVFLDEIGDLPLEMQVKLLRVLEGRSFRRIGAAKDQEFRGRVIAATHRDLRKMVSAGTFREDLYYRLNVLHIEVPPLRDHIEDIPMLAYYFARTFNEEQRAGGGPARMVKVIHPDVIRAMLAYDWPGNVRDVYRNIKRMMIHGDGEVLGPEGLDEEIMEAGRRAGALGASAPPTASPPPAAQVVGTADVAFSEAWMEKGFTEARRDLDRLFGQWYLTKALAMSGGNKTRAADVARLQRPNLVRALKVYDVTLPGGSDE